MNEINANMYKLYSFAIMMALAIGGMARGKDDGIELTRNFNKTFEVDANAQVNLKANDTDLTLETWDKNTVEVNITVVVHAENNTDAQEFLDAVAPTINGTRTNVTVSNDLCFRKMISNGNNIRIWMQDGGGKITIQDYRFTMHIKMPKQNGLDLQARYTNASLGDLAGPVNIHGVDANITGGDITGSGRMKLTYGSSRFNDLSGLDDLQLFEEHFSCSSFGDLDLNSRYSDLDFGTAGKLVVKSFEDEIQMGDVREMEGKMNYSDVRMKNAGVLDLELFETNIRGEKVDEIEFEAKYCKFDFTTIGKMDAEDFENRYEADAIEHLEADGKYSRYEFDRLSGSLDMSGFECNLEVDLLASTVTRVDVEGKYLDVELTPAADLAFDLDVNLQYTDLDFFPAQFTNAGRTTEDNINFVAKSNKPNPGNVLFMFNCFEGSVELNKP